MEKNNEYTKLVEEKSPKSKFLWDLLKAFLVGGAICLVGEVLRTVLSEFIENKTILGGWVCIIMVFIGAFLTGIGVYDKIGKFGGAGALVPITGFANGITSPAMEFKTEGFVLGLGAKMFIIAGPVIVYGTVASTAVGIIYYIISMF